MHNLVIFAFIVFVVIPLWNRLDRIMDRLEGKDEAESHLYDEY